MARTFVTVPALYHIEGTEHKYKAATQALGDFARRGRRGLISGAFEPCLPF
jgi:hypothetical protein